MAKRCWELDALRGICLLGMVGIHLMYDLRVSLPLPLRLVQDWGGCAFLLLSGLCVTLGHRPVRRGLVVLGCGMVCTLVTWGMRILGVTDYESVIWFGVLHCLGVCMLLWPVFRQLPSPCLGALGGVWIALGYALEHIWLDGPWLMPLGIRYPGFVSADYFPLFPNLGFFLLGAVLGRTLYRKKESLLPNVRPNRFLCFCGRHSLAIYLLHQPILYGILLILNV